MADYVQRLTAGSKVRVERTDGSISARHADESDRQRDRRAEEHARARVPVEVPLGQLARVTVETGGASTGKAVAIGIVSGVGAFFAILAIAFAASGD
jgi:hypothetical protein